MNERSEPVRLDDLPDLLTEAEAGAVLRVSRMTLYRMRRDGRITAVKLRGAIRYRKSDLERMLSGDETA